MMIWRTCAVGAEVAVDWVARVALVGVHLQVALGELEGILGSELVEGKFTAGLELAGLAMAEDVGLGVGRELDLPFNGFAVAVASEGL